MQPPIADIWYGDIPGSMDEIHRGDTIQESLSLADRFFRLRIWSTSAAEVKKNIWKL